MLLSLQYKPAGPVVRRNAVPSGANFESFTVSPWRLPASSLHFQPGTVTLIGRGQIHTVQEAEGLNATVVRFNDELLSGRMAWLVAGSNLMWRDAA